MQDKEGNLYNPYDGGYVANLLDFFYIKYLPRNEDGDYVMINPLKSWQTIMYD